MAGIIIGSAATLAGGIFTGFWLVNKGLDALDRRRNRTGRAYVQAHTTIRNT